MAAKEEIKLGKSVSLDQRLDYIPDTLAGRKTFEYKMEDFMDKGGYYKIKGFDDVLSLNTQSSSQWDGLRHIAIQESGLHYGGVHRDKFHDRKDGTLGTHRKLTFGRKYYETLVMLMLCLTDWVDNGGIVGRGVLLDYPRWRKETGQSAVRPDTEHAISPDELELVAKHQNLTFRAGDILILRSGFSEMQNNQNQADNKASLDRGEYIGLERTMTAAEWLWNQHFAAVASDNPGFEACPTPFGVTGKIVLHEWILDHWGMPLGEFWNLETLAELCAKQKQWSFFLTSAPLHVFGGVASPPNAIAIL